MTKENKGEVEKWYKKRKNIKKGFFLIGGFGQWQTCLFERV